MPDLDADPRKKLYLGIAALVCVLALGWIVDLVFQGPAADPAALEQTQTSEDESGGTGSSGADVSQGESSLEEEAESVTLSGLTLTHSERLGALGDSGRARLSQGLTLWLEALGSDATTLDVTRDSVADQSSQTSWVELAGEEAKVVWDGSWTVSYKGSDTTIEVPADSSGESKSPETPVAASVSDESALTPLVGDECAKQLKSVWEAWAASKGVPADGATVDPKSVSALPDGSGISFRVSASDGTGFPAVWSTDGTTTISDSEA